MSVSSHVRTVYVHEYTASGSYVGDVLKVIAVAQKAAEHLGVNTSYDDWAEVTVDGDICVSFKSTAASGGVGEPGAGSAGEDPQ